MVGRLILPTAAISSSVSTASDELQVWLPPPRSAPIPSKDSADRPPGDRGPQYLRFRLLAEPEGDRRW